MQPEFIQQKAHLHGHLKANLVLHGIQLWGCAARSQREEISCFQNKALRLITGALFYGRNTQLHADMNIDTVDTVIFRYAQRHECRLHRHLNNAALELPDMAGDTRRLKRRHPVDLF